jgi:putative heme-binding domain-containing protein
MLTTAFLLLAAAQGAQPPLEDPKEILKGVKVPPGWTATLFAAPPNVGYPTCIAAAPNGDLFVGIDENGSIDAKPDRGRILKLSDTDGDGVADRVRVFAASVDSPRGLVWDGRTLYVLHPPFLRAFHDEDGDGVAERSEVLVQGIGFDLKFRGADHTTNGIQMGIDGWIYVAVGDYGFVKAVGRDGTSLQLHGGGIARVRPDGTDLELFCDGLRNVYDVAVSPSLEVFTRDNTNDGGGWNVRLSHLVPTGRYGYPTLFKNFPEDIVPALADYGGGSPCGSLWLSEPGFPEGYGDALYTCDWGRGVVYRHPLKRKGATFLPEQQPFVEMHRPVDMDVDGSGHVYLASWRNGGFTYGGPNVGYILRVTPPGTREPYRNDDLVAGIGSASHVRRFHAQRELLRRPGRAAEAPKLQALGTPAALCTLGQMGIAPTGGDLAVRLRVLADRPAAAPALDVFTQALRSDDPRVRLEAAFAIGRLGRPEGAAALVPLTGDADPVVVHVAVRALQILKARGSGVLRVLQDLHEPAVVDDLLERLPKAADSEQRRAVLRTLCRLHFREADWDGRWWGTRPDTTGPYFKPVAWEATTRIAAALKTALAGEDARFLLRELPRHRIVFDELVPLALKAAAEDPSLRSLAADVLAQRPGLTPEGIAFLESVAGDAKAEAAVRLRAAGALQKAGAMDALLRVWTALEPKAPGELVQARDEFTRDSRHARQAARFQQLAVSGSAEARRLGLAVLASLSQHKNSPKDLKESAQKTVEAALRGAHPEEALRGIALARADAYVHPVRGFLKDPRKDVQAAAKEAARALKLDAATGNKATIQGMAVDAVRAAVFAEKGDVKQGAELFVKQGCVACHTISPHDVPKGPYLGDIATRYKRDELFESVLLPNAKIAQGFTTHGFETKEGDRYEGFVVRESGEEVELRNVLGVSITLKLAEVAKRDKLETSIMPTGLIDPLTPAEFASLLAYLESLRPK